MPPSIELTDATFGRLQKYATPLVDTPESTVAKILDLIEATAADGLANGQPDLDPHVPPDLTHTKVTAAKVNGKALPAAQRYWNAIFLVAAHQAANKLPKAAKISDLILANHVLGKREDSGYKYQEELNLSIQGQDSNAAWKSIAYLARETGLVVDVEFAWLETPKAAHPGQTGHLRIGA